MRPIGFFETVREKLARLRCKKGGMAADKHGKCKCVNCQGYRRMVQAGENLHIIVHVNGEWCCIIEGNDM